MKYIILLLALSGLVSAQPIKSPGVNGENIVNPAFRNAVLPSQSTHSGKFLTTDGSGAVTWASVTSNLTSGPVTSSGGVSAIADGAIEVAKITGLGTAATAAATDFQATMKGVVVTKANGTRTSYAPSVGTDNLAGDTARGLALEAAFAAAVAGDTIDLSPGNYYVAKAGTNLGVVVQYIILDKMTINLNGARLYHTSAENAKMFFGASVGTSYLAHDWSLNGPGILEGTVTTPSGTVTGVNAGTGECGVYIGGASGYSYRGKIHGVTVRYMKNGGIMCDSAAFPALKFTNVKISNCVLDYNKTGLMTFPGNEYIQVINTSANYCQRGFDIGAGNTFLVNCQANGTTSDGAYFHSSGNHGHGSWIGGGFNHNYNNAVSFATGFTLGWTFSGVHFEGSNGTTDNKIVLNGYGININAGILDSPIYTTAVNSGINSLDNVRISANPTTILTNLFAGSRVKLKISGCKTMTADWNQNDIRTTYADDTAAGVGGVLQGEPWQQTTTGAMFIKL